MKKSSVSKENWDDLRPAGKVTKMGDPVSELIHSQVLLQQNNVRA